jgi:hypothetical protein
MHAYWHWAGTHGEESTVLMRFPTEVTLTLPGGRIVYFAEGTADVAASLADHPYLADSGVTRV